MQPSLLFCILHGSIYSHRVESIKSTWGANTNILFYADYDDEPNQVIKVSNRTDYGSNEEKHVQAIKHISSHYDFDWYMFCDDDTFVNTKKLDEIIKDLDAECIHGSVITGCWPQDISLQYCSGGAGYLIHKNVLRKLASQIEVKHTDYSDVTLGLYLRDMGIKCQNDDGFRSQNPQFYGIPNDQVHNYVSFHYIKTPQEMARLHTFCKEHYDADLF
jgi:hypothetical protein